MTPVRPLVLLLAALALLAPSAAAAYPDPDRAPRYHDSECYAKYDRRFVHDYLGMMDPQMAAEVEGAACEVYAATGAHFVLVTVDDTDGEPLESYTLHLFEAWGVGNAERLDGLMLLYVRDYDLEGQSSAVRVEPGYGLEGVITPPVAREAITLMRDARDAAMDAGEAEHDARAYGLAVGSAYLLNTLHDNHVDGAFPEPSRSPFVRARDVPPIVWIVAILLILAVISALTTTSRRPRRGWGYYPGSPHWSSGLGGAMVGSLGRGGWGGGGGGFGGGRSGGGGGSGGF